MENFDSHALLVTQRHREIDNPEKDADLWHVGVIGRVSQMLRLPDGSVKALVHGISRIRVRDIEVTPEGYLSAYAEEIPTEEVPEAELQAHRRTLDAVLAEYAENARKIPGGAPPDRPR